MLRHCQGVSLAASIPALSRDRLLPAPADVIRAVGTTSTGKQVASAKTLTITTPQLGAPTLVSANPTGPSTGVVILAPPTGASATTVYTVKACLQAQRSSCIKASGTSAQLSVSRLAAGATYVVSASATVNGQTRPSSNTLLLRMPAKGAPTLLTAAPSSARTGTATAAAPSGTNFDQVTRLLGAGREAGQRLAWAPLSTQHK